MLYTVDKLQAIKMITLGGILLTNGFTLVEKYVLFVMILYRK